MAVAAAPAAPPLAARPVLYLDAPLPAPAADLPPGLRLRFSTDASCFPYSHPRGLPSAVRVARVAKELLSEPAGSDPPPRWLVLADDDTAFVLPNLLHTLRKYDWREPWYLGARSESTAQNAWHGFAMAYGGGIAISWPLAWRLARALDSYVELIHEPGFHQTICHIWLANCQHGLIHGESRV
ncbi:hypothetical protein ACP70R_007743 [Stipagrostis hirtigluma subsp. patula]